MSKTDSYAVFGHPINHSKSPRIHSLFAEQADQNIDYVAKDVPAECFRASANAFFNRGGKGLNCTVPLKELAWQYADVLTERAQLAKAVNTLALQDDGTIIGDNTDGIGLIRDLTINLGIKLIDKRILILGAGGASRGILAPLLAEQPRQLIIANRSVEKADTLANQFSALGAISSARFSDLNGQFDLIINATSASLSNQLPPMADNLLSNTGCCYDLAYANQPTAFVHWGIEHGASKSIDGLGMLVEQAAEAFYLWRQIRPDTQPIIRLLGSERQTH